MVQPPMLEQSPQASPLSEVADLMDGLQISTTLAGEGDVEIENVDIGGTGSSASDGRLPDTRPGPYDKSAPNRVRGCYICGSPNHLKKHCPAAKSRKPQADNGEPQSTDTTINRMPVKTSTKAMKKSKPPKLWNQTKFCENCLNGGHDPCEKMADQYALVFKGHPDLKQVAAYTKPGLKVTKPQKVKDFAFDLVATGELIAGFTFWRTSRNELRRNVSSTCNALKGLPLAEELKVAEDEMCKALDGFYARADNMTVGFQKGLFRLLCDGYAALQSAASNGTMQPADVLSVEKVWDWATNHGDEQISIHKLIETFCFKRFSTEWAIKPETLYMKCMVLTDDILRYLDSTRRMQVMNAKPTFKLLFARIPDNVATVDTVGHSRLQRIDYYDKEITDMITQIANSLAAVVGPSES